MTWCTCGSSSQSTSRTVADWYPSPGTRYERGVVSACRVHQVAGPDAEVVHVDSAGKFGGAQSLHHCGPEYVRWVETVAQPCDERPRTEGSGLVQPFEFFRREEEAVPDLAHRAENPRRVVVERDHDVDPPVGADLDAIDQCGPARQRQVDDVGVLRWAQPDAGSGAP